MPSYRLRLALIAMALPFVFGCATSDPEPQPMSQVEMRNMQTRQFDTNDSKLVMKAMLSTLQDMGFIVNSADADLGYISANKWTEVQHSKKEMKKAKKDETPLAQNIVLECTANVTIQGGAARVRANFQKKTVDTAGNTMQAGPIEDAAFYQTFFSKVDKGLFLESSGV
ncbi:MAG: hypothetical protein AMXMBFR84_20610 [Candidatus Hydrogenedentota bacterium]